MSCPACGSSQDSSGCCLSCGYKASSLDEEGTAPAPPTVRPHAGAPAPRPKPQRRPRISGIAVALVFCAVALAGPLVGVLLWSFLCEKLVPPVSDTILATLGVFLLILGSALLAAGFVQIFIPRMTSASKRMYAVALTAGGVGLLLNGGFVLHLCEWTGIDRVPVGVAFILAGLVLTGLGLWIVVWPPISLCNTRAGWELPPAGLALVVIGIAVIFVRVDGVARSHRPSPPTDNAPAKTDLIRPVDAAIRILENRYGSRDSLAKLIEDSRKEAESIQGELSHLQREQNDYYSQRSFAGARQLNEWRAEASRLRSQLREAQRDLKKLQRDYEDWHE